MFTRVLHFTGGGGVANTSLCINRVRMLIEILIAHLLKRYVVQCSILQGTGHVINHHRSLFIIGVSPFVYITHIIIIIITLKIVFLSYCQPYQTSVSYLYETRTYISNQIYVLLVSSHSAGQGLVFLTSNGPTSKHV
jgi:hypothetical protein